MKNSDESEMRPEYDFSKAQRSRYASRLSDQNRRDILRRSAALDAQVYFARALQLVQELEAVVVAYLILAFGQSLEGAEHGTIALLEGRDRIMLSRLSPAMNGDEDFVTRFNDLMVERNWLVHKGALELSPDIEEPSS